MAASMWADPDPPGELLIRPSVVCDTMRRLALKRDWPGEVSRGCGYGYELAHRYLALSSFAAACAEKGLPLASLRRRPERCLRPCV